VTQSTRHSEVLSRSAFEMTFSIVEMGSLWLTPDLLSIRLSAQAEAICSMISCGRQPGLSPRGPAIDPGLLSSD
jgi:hypothetical protein